MRCLTFACLLTTLASIAVACGSSDDKKVSHPEAGGAGAAGAPGAASGMVGTGMALAGMAAGAAEPPGGAGGSGDRGSAGAAAAGRGGTDGGSAGDTGLGGAGCAPAPSTLAGQLQGHWLICGALATNDRIWNALLTFDSSSCSEAELTGTFHWITTNSGTSEGNTRFIGSHDAETGIITLQEYEVTGGNVVQATDTFKFDPDSDTLFDGAWTCSCSPGSWTTAMRVADGTDVDSCP